MTQNEQKKDLENNYFNYFKWVDDNEEIVFIVLFCLFIAGIAVKRVFTYGF